MRCPFCSDKWHCLLTPLWSSMHRDLKSEDSSVFVLHPASSLLLSVCFSIMVWVSCPTGLFFILWLFSATQPNKVKCLRCFSVPCDCAIRRCTACPSKLPSGEGLTPAFPLFSSLWLFSGLVCLHLLGLLLEKHSVSAQIP